MRFRTFGSGLAVFAALVGLGRSAAAADVENQPATFTVAAPDHRFDLAARLGAISGGEVTPKGLAQGHTQPSWVLLVDFDAIVHPFFTVGAYGALTSQGYERYASGAKTNTDGSMTTGSLGASAKARIPLGAQLVAKAGIYAGYNIESFSVTEGGKTIGASGSGINVGLSLESAYAVSRQFALTAQVGFLSQVSGGVSIDGDSTSHDLAFTPKAFVTVGPEIHF